MAMVTWLKGSVNTKREICSLSPAELECMAEAATAAWIVAASHRTVLTDGSLEDVRDAAAVLALFV